jgi:hypothetical protein
MPIAPGNPGQRLAHDGRHRYYWLPDVEGDVAVSDVAAITVSELGDANDLSRYVPKDGLQGTPSFNRIPSTDVTEVFDAEQMGTWSFSPTLQLYMQQPDNNAFELFAFGDKGLFIDFPFVAQGADPEAGDVYYAYRLETSAPVPLPFTTNEKQRFQLEASVLSAPVYDGTLVA